MTKDLHVFLNLADEPLILHLIRSSLQIHCTYILLPACDVVALVCLCLLVFWVWDKGCKSKTERMWSTISYKDWENISAHQSQWACCVKWEALVLVSTGLSGVCLPSFSQNVTWAGFFVLGEARSFHPPHCRKSDPADWDTKVWRSWISTENTTPILAADCVQIEVDPLWFSTKTQTEWHQIDLFSPLNLLPPRPDRADRPHRCGHGAQLSSQGARLINKRKRPSFGETTWICHWDNLTWWEELYPFTVYLSDHNSNNHVLFLGQMLCAHTFFLFSSKAFG